MVAPSSAATAEVLRRAHGELAAGPRSAASSRRAANQRPAVLRALGERRHRHEAGDAAPAHAREEGVELAGRDPALARLAGDVDLDEHLGRAACAWRASCASDRVAGHGVDQAHVRQDLARPCGSAGGR